MTVCKRAIEHNRTEGGDGGRAAELAGNNGVRVCLVWEKSRGKGGGDLVGSGWFCFSSFDQGRDSEICRLRQGKTLADERAEWC